MDNIHTITHSAANGADVHRGAYNAAFYELGLKWHWDADMYQSVLPHAEEKLHIRKYLETHQPHLLKAYDAEFLTDAIHTAKQRKYDAMLACNCSDACKVDWAEIQKIEIGI
jgi:hypothetical protein